MRKQLVFILLFTLVNFLSSAQQNGLFSQYMFNAFVVNPAYAGSRDATSAVILIRDQWNVQLKGVTGAPQSLSASLHSPIKQTNAAWGLNIIGDQIGPLRTGAIMGTYAYRLKMRKGRLAFAIRAGVINQHSSTLIFNNPDPNNPGTTRDGDFNIDFGAYYHTPSFYVGFSASNLNKPGFQFDTITTTNEGGNATWEIQRHYALVSGTVFELSENLIFKPSVNLKFLKDAPGNIDVNASFLLKKKLWVGASYRTSNIVSAMLEINPVDFLRIGYAYDFGIGGAVSGLSSNEIFLGWDFRAPRKKTETPKYL